MSESSSPQSPLLETDFVDFCVEPVDAVADLCGDPTVAEFVAFMNGNQFMVLPNLMEAFKAHNPALSEIFYESLPPGILVEQVRRGGLRMGSMRLAIKADVLAASPDALAKLEGDGLAGPAVEYARNDLALLVAKGNPAGISDISDLARPDVKVAMPDPKREGVGRLMVDAMESFGGSSLVGAVMEEKVSQATTRLTRIHHRQTPLWLRCGEADVGPVWRTEARFHIEAGAPFEMIELPQEHNQWGTYALAVLTQAPHPQSAQAFMDFIAGQQAQQIYRSFGFSPPCTDG